MLRTQEIGSTSKG